MHEIHRALIVILVLTVPLLWVIQRFICPNLVSVADYRRRSTVWIAMVVVAFLMPSFWGVMFLFAVLAGFAMRGESRPLSLFVFIVFAVPPVALEIPGFLGINQLFSLSYPRVLSLVVLLPAWWALSKDPSMRAWGRHPCDILVFGYAALHLILLLQSVSITATGRAGLHLTLDILLPYCVASRSLRSLNDWRDLVASFVVGVLVLVPLAAFEFVKEWLLYSALPVYWDVHSWVPGYLMRGDVLRARVSAGHSIIFGFMMVIVLALSPYLGAMMNRYGRWGLGVLLTIGLLAPFSRGPWVGAVVVLALLLVSTPIPRRSLIRLVIAAGFAMVCISVTPVADDIVGLIPFVGTVDSGSVDYRARLFDAAWIVIQMNPWFGSTTYMSTPEMLSMVQGEGIIDLVNVYLNVALDHGFVGLALFSGAFFVALVGVGKRKRQADLSTEERILGGCLVAALGGILVVIATLSNFLNIPTLYTLVIGLAISYTMMPSQGMKRKYIDRQ
jgi:hypothetical protein